jgi:uncharacterized iron-regulated protein
VAGCAAGARPLLPPIDRSADHPLIGRIWASAEHRFLTADELASRLRDARVVLLGESHDNPRHHQGEAWIVRTLVDQGRHPVVALEMITTEEAKAADSCREARCSVLQFAEAVRWNERGWPDWRIYAPLLAEILTARSIVVPASLSRTAEADIITQGDASSSHPFVERLALDEPLPAAVHASMAEEIRQAHCGHAPEGKLDAMIQVQRLRDGFMADSLAAARTGATAVLIAGAGHVRTDRGVPPLLERLVPGVPVVAIGFVEVAQGSDDPAAYADPPFPFVWFTEPATSEDPCEKFREQLRKLR